MPRHVMAKTKEFPYIRALSRNSVKMRNGRNRKEAEIFREFHENSKKFHAIP